MATVLKLFPAPPPTRSLLYDVDVLRNGNLVRIIDQGLPKFRAERMARDFGELNPDSDVVAVVTVHVQPAKKGGAA